MTHTVWARWRHHGLAARIVSTSLLLLLLVQLAGYALVRSFIADNARTQIQHELAVGERVWERVLAQNAAKLSLGATVLAADFGFRDAIGTGDMETMRSALDNHGARIGAKVAAYFDAQLVLQAVSQPEAQALSPAALTALATEFREAAQGSRVTRVGQLPFQFVMVPIRAPLVVGWVMMGFPIDQALADDVYQLLDVHMAIALQASADAASSDGGAVLVSTLGSGWRLPRSLPPDAIWPVAGQDMVVHVLAMDGWAPDLQVLLLRSVDEVLAPFVRLQGLLLAVTVLGLALFAAGSVVNARRVTRPLLGLLQSTRRLESGDFDTPVPTPERDDEVGALSRAFDHMRRSVAQKQGEIRQLAYWDRLTGLPNREQFRHALTDALAAAQGPVSVITLNLDRFKHVNDVLGYAFGDDLLKAVALRLQAVLPGQQDLLARLGGDVFGLMVCQAGPGGAEALTSSIVHAFEQPLTLHGQTVDVSASMGVAAWPIHAPDTDTLLARSEMAMHVAKERTAGVVVYEPSLDSSSAQNLSLLTDLRRALDRGELRLFLQPKVAVASGQVVAAEALVRWQDPMRGLVPPMQFIPFAEQTGFIRQLTLWVLDEAARQWHALQQPGRPVRVAVNLSTRDLLDLAFPERLGELLARHGVASSGFCLEITESAIMDDPQRAQATLERLATLGFKLSIDDFGTGYSSLAYLKNLPVGELKIDKSFVMGMVANDSDAKIVRSTVDLAHNLGLTVVAEGVEDAAVLHALRGLGCDEAQGYHISRPVPAGEFGAVCERWHQRCEAPTIGG